MRAYVVDIDGTLSNCQSRIHYIENGGSPNWDAFYDECDKDEPIRNVIDVIQAIALKAVVKEEDVRIFYLTGRPERVRVKTTHWLVDNKLPNGILLMRADGDHRPDTVVKPEKMRDLIASGYEIAGIFEDRPAVCRVWLEMGLTLFQVGNGREF